LFRNGFVVSVEAANMKWRGFAFFGIPLKMHFIRTAEKAKS